MGNRYFVAEEASQRLPEDSCVTMVWTPESFSESSRQDWAMASLELLNETLCKRKAVHVNTFISDFCRPMHAAAQWIKFLQTKFGAAAVKLPVVQRCIRLLQSEGALRNRAVCCCFAIAHSFPIPLCLEEGA